MTRARRIMIQGTGSDVGKSVMVAGLCRIARRRGVTVWPFKPQNMSNNAAVAADGGEIGRAQWLQARAAKVAPSVHMNPVLLKPEGDRASAVVVQGRPAGRLQAGQFRERRKPMLAPVLESFAIAQLSAELVIVEGAGSPAETNLRQGDIANMGFAEATATPIILVGDIDRGGVIASLVGTHAVLTPGERMLIKAFVINKFRGAPALFADGIVDITRRTDWPCLGVIPWLAAARLLPAEDAVRLDAPASASNAPLVIAVPMLSRIANFDDADPLAAEPDVDLRMIPPGQALPRDADLIFLPGTKSTRADMAFLVAQGWDIDIRAHIRHGGRVLGLCGGFQLLGRAIHDPDGIDGPAGSVAGLGLLDVETVMTADKTVTTVEGQTANGHRVTGYEIHNGATTGPDCAQPFVTLDGAPNGARRADGLIEGCYIHGLFGADGFRRAYLEGLGAPARALINYDAQIEAALEALADGLEEALDVKRLFAIAAS